MDKIAVEFLLNYSQNVEFWATLKNSSVKMIISSNKKHGTLGLPAKVIIAILFIAFFLATLLFTSKSFAQPTPSREATFYTLDISRTESIPVISLNKVVHVTGEFKIPAQKKLAYDAGMLLVRVTDKSNRNIYETLIVNPLSQSIEFVNEHGQYERTLIEDSAGTIDFRIPFNTTDHTVVIYSVYEHQRLVELISL